VTSVIVLFCFLLQNFTEIGQSAAESWPKTIFNMAAVCHLEFKKKIIFEHPLLSSSSKCASVYQISSKSDNFSLKYGNFTIFKMADLEF